MWLGYVTESEAADSGRLIYTTPMTIEEQLERLTGIVSTLATSVVAHDNQIEGLIRVAEKQDAQIAALAEQVANTERQWQAYINTLPRH